MESSLSATTVNGIEGYWIRARLVSGNYGEDARFEYRGSDREPRRIPVTLAPPSIQSITVSSGFTAGPEQVQQIVVNNHLFYERIPAGASFQPFQIAPIPYRALYLGFLELAFLPPPSAFAKERPEDRVPDRTGQVGLVIAARSLPAYTRLEVAAEER